VSESSFTSRNTTSGGRSEYKEVLHKWAEDKLPVSVSLGKVTDVAFDFDKGYGGGCDTCGYGADEDKMTIWIAYEDSKGHSNTYSTSMGIYSFESSMGEVLRELFTIAENEEA